MQWIATVREADWYSHVGEDTSYCRMLAACCNEWFNTYWSALQCFGKQY